MTKSSNLKGCIFEWFIRNILKSCGFTKVPLDDFIIYDRTKNNDLMIHGIGQPHNADILMAPPLQIPFYFPSRILVECKAYGDTVGLDTIRGVLGLREDINNFEILTPEILSERRSYRRKNPATYDYERFSYQVAFASLKGIKNTALEFALAHRIPIISLYKSGIFTFLKTFIESLDLELYSNLSDEAYSQLLNYFKTDKRGFPVLARDRRYLDLRRFICQSRDLFKRMYIGVLTNGDIIFLYGPTTKFKATRLEYYSVIHWRVPESAWNISFKENEKEINLFFELPDKLYNSWADTKFDKKKAINMKEKEFNVVSIYSTDEEGNLIFFVLNLDKDFIKEAKQRIEDNNIEA